MWNRKHNSTDKISGHTYVRNWKIAVVPIKVHPSDEYCNGGGVDCQYLRFKDPERKHPYCLWNLEYRGIDRARYRNDDPTFKSSKHPLLINATTNRVVKAEFCQSLGHHYGRDDNTWENTMTYKEETSQEE